MLNTHTVYTPIRRQIKTTKRTIIGYSNYKCSLNYSLILVKKIGRKPDEIPQLTFLNDMYTEWLASTRIPLNPFQSSRKKYIK